MSKNYMPGTDTKSQNFNRAYRGSAQKPSTLVFHSTEGRGWPGYSGGASAPNMTLKPYRKRMVSRSHYPADRSSRALENRGGGVETNTLNVYQIEVIGTCDPATKRKWERQGYKQDVHFLYMPDLPDWALQGIADVIRWLHKEWGMKVRDAAPRGWAPYPKSYGTGARQRMSFKEWQGAYGVCGHQHVPENSHGDPGNVNIKRLIALANGKPMEEDDDMPTAKELWGSDIVPSPSGSKTNTHWRVSSVLGVMLRNSMSMATNVRAMRADIAEMLEVQKKQATAQGVSAKEVEAAANAGAAKALNDKIDDADVTLNINE